MSSTVEQLQAETDRKLEQIRAEGGGDPLLLQHSHIDAPYPENWQQLHPPEVDSDRWPDFARARWYEAVLEPGDGLLLPAYWWHWVFSSDECVSVQFFHDADVESPGDSSYLPDPAAPESPARLVDQCSLPDDGAGTCLSEVAEHRAARQPLLVRGSASHWPCMGWTADRVLSDPSAPVTRYVVSEGRSLCPIEKPFPAYGDSGTSVPVAGPSEVQAALADRGSKVVQWVVPLTPRSAGLLGGIRMPPGVDPRRISNINMWCNAGRCHTGLHYDKYHNFIVGVKGTKRILLYPQTETPHLYLRPFPPEAIKSWKDERKAPDAP